MKIPTTLKPVSYTHLDVYKRQGIARSWEGLGNPAKARNLPQFLEVHKMAQKVVGYIKLQIPAGKAT